MAEGSRPPSSNSDDGMGDKRLVHLVLGTSDRSVQLKVRHLVGQR